MKRRKPVEVKIRVRMPSSLSRLDELCDCGLVRIALDFSTADEKTVELTFTAQTSDSRGSVERHFADRCWLAGLNVLTEDPAERWAEDEDAAESLDIRAW